MLVRVNYKLHVLFSFGFGQAPPQSLESRRHFDLFIESEQKLFYLVKVKRRQFLFWLGLLTRLLESVLKLLLNGSDLFLKRVVLVAIVIALLRLTACSQLLLVLFNEGRLHHIDSVFAVNLV